MTDSKPKTLLLIAAVALMVAVVVGPAAGPVAADTVPMTTTRAICVYRDPGAYWDLYSYRTIHYGSAHVTQCAFREYLGRYWLCYQYVWNIPDPYWASYVGDGDPSSPCW